MYHLLQFLRIVCCYEDASAPIFVLETTLPSHELHKDKDVYFHHYYPKQFEIMAKTKQEKDSKGIQVGIEKVKLLFLWMTLNNT